MEDRERDAVIFQPLYCTVPQVMHLYMNSMAFQIYFPTENGYVFYCPFFKRLVSLPSILFSVWRQALIIYVHRLMFDLFNFLRFGFISILWIDKLVLTSCCKVANNNSWFSKKPFIIANTFSSLKVSSIHWDQNWLLSWQSWYTANLAFLGESQPDTRLVKLSSNSTG